MKRLSVTDGTKHITIPRGEYYVIKQDLEDILYITLESGSQLILDGTVKCYNLVCHPNSSIIFNKEVIFDSILLKCNVEAFFKAIVRCRNFTTEGESSLYIKDLFVCQNANFSEDTGYYPLSDNAEAFICTDPRITQSINNNLVGDTIDRHDNS